MGKSTISEAGIVLAREENRVIRYLANRVDQLATIPANWITDEERAGVAKLLSEEQAWVAKQAAKAAYYATPEGQKEWEKLQERRKRRERAKLRVHNPNDIH